MTLGVKREFCGYVSAVAGGIRANIVFKSGSEIKQCTPNPFTLQTP